MEKKITDFNIIIDPERVQKEYLKDLVRYRGLFYFFIWRDILVRYKQTLLGITWAVIRPLIYMAVFVLVFGKIAHLDETSQVSYPLFILSGMIPWQLYATCLMETSGCLINNAPLISKVYFPRILLPLNCIMVCFIDFLVSIGMLFLWMLVTGTFNPLTLIALPLIIILTLTFCLGSSLWLSALTVRYRDFRFLMPFITQFGMFISPIGYSSALLSPNAQWIYFLNPMAGIIEGFRWSCFGIYHDYLPLALSLSTLISSLILLTGFFYFRKMERIFADII